MTDYKPGTVAKVADPVYGELTAILIEDGDSCWHGMIDGHFRCVRANEVTDVRPLVTVDLADLGPAAIDFPATFRETAKRNADSGWTGAACILDNLADQIEAQTRPPKPAEPTGRWAVVEGRDGNRWVRDDNTAAHPWRHIGPVDLSANWGGVCVYAPITVHHDGVTA